MVSGLAPGSAGWLRAQGQAIVAAAKHGKAVWVLDRPNPIGRPVEGLTRRPGWESFVGAGPMPMRHGLTLGEMGRWFIATLGLDVEYRVIRSDGTMRWVRNKAEAVLDAQGRPLRALGVVSYITGRQEARYLAQMGHERHSAHQRQYDGNHGGRTDEIIISPPDQLKHEPSADGETDRQKCKRPQNCLRNGPDVERAPRCEAEDDSDNDPADGVVDDRRSDDDLADVASHEIHFANDNGNYLYG